MTQTITCQDCGTTEERRGPTQLRCVACADRVRRQRNAEKLRRIRAEAAKAPRVRRDSGAHRLPSDPALRLVTGIATEMYGYGDRPKVGTPRSFYDRVGELMGCSTTSASRMIQRAGASGTISVFLADAICVAVGRHPIEVYGSAWLDPTPPIRANRGVRVWKEAVTA